MGPWGVDNSPVFLVGPWTVEPDRLRLRNGDQRVTLQPKVMSLLQHLAARQGAVVSHEELLGAVWPGRVVEDGAVYQTLAKLRKALGDDCHAPRYIETVPTKGYRLIAPVMLADPADGPESKEVRQPLAPRRGIWRSI